MSGCIANIYFKLGKLLCVSCVLLDGRFLVTNYMCMHNPIGSWPLIKATCMLYAGERLSIANFQVTLDTIVPI